MGKQEGVCPFPLPLLCYSLPFAVCVLPLSLLPTFSVDNRRDSPGGGVLLIMTFLGSKMQSAKRLLDGVLNENGAPHLLSGSVDKGRIPAWAGGGDSGKEACPTADWPGPETLCPPRATGHVPRGTCPCRPCPPSGQGGNIYGKRKCFPPSNRFGAVPTPPSSSSSMESGHS